MNVNPSSKINETVSWVGKWTFVLAAAGSAVGLGNIWGFPYKAGTEGGGVSDVIFGDYSPTGKLSFSWPRDISQIPANYKDKNYDPLFEFSYGLKY